MDFNSLPGQLRGSRSWGHIAGPLQHHLLHHPQEAFEVAAVLDHDLDLHGHDLAVSAVRESLFSIVCRARPDSATSAAWRLGADPRREHPGIPLPSYDRERNAMELAATRPLLQVHALLDGGELLTTDPEFGLLLVHELILRRQAVPRSATSYQQWAAETEHPFAVLPLLLLDDERELPEQMPKFGGEPGGLSGSVVSPALRDPVALNTLLPGLTASVAASDDGAHQLFADWGDPEHSVVVRRHRYGTEFLPSDGEPTPAGLTEAEVVGMSSVLGAMFCAAVGGGAYTDGPGGAWSRVRVWRAMADIVDAEWPTQIGQLAARASSWRWISLAVDREPWFDCVAWDFWYLADDGERVVSIAASDSD